MQHQDMWPCVVWRHPQQHVVQYTNVQQWLTADRYLMLLLMLLSAGSLSLLPPGASPHALAGLLKRFLLGLPEPLLTYR